MKKNVFLNFKIALVTLILIFGIAIKPIDAATFTVSKSSVTLYVGDKTTITVKASGVAGGPFSVSSSKSSVASVSGLNGEWLENSNGKITITAKAEGTATISVKATVANLNDSSDEDTVTKKITVTVKKKTSTNTNTNTNTNKPTTPTVSKSSDNALKTLTISKGELSPKFNADKTTYNVDLAGDTTEITINASANHAKATVSGTGTKKLVPGENVFDIVCKAENGSKKTYKINVYVDETPLVYTKFNDINLGVVRTVDGIKIPQGFKKNTIIIEGQEVTGFTNEKLKMDIAYLIDESGKSDFYVIKDGKALEVYRTITVNNKIYVVQTGEALSDMIASTLELDNVVLNAYEFDATNLTHYKLVYLMNENGEACWYSYEDSEGTLQKYTEFVQIKDEAVEEPQEELPLEYIFMGTTAFFALTTLIMMIVHTRFKKKSIAAIKDYYQSRNQG